MRRWILALTLLLATAPLAPIFAQDAPHAVSDLPAFFVDTFLHFPDDAADAAKANKRLLLYFGQDGCPYCKELIQTNFSQKAIADLTRENFLPIGLNLWGDRETTWFDGQLRSEKELAKHLKVQFTPTVLLLDEKGRIVARINGYYPPHRFIAALQFAAQRLEQKLTFAEHMIVVPQIGASATLNEEPFFMSAPFDLSRKPGGKTLAVLFETRHCAPCDELHREGFRRSETLKALSHLDFARFSLSGRDELTRPEGGKTRAEAWARELKISYTPTVVFFDDTGKEVFRIEAYVRPFHFTSSFEYAASGAYLREPEFQRFLQNKTEHLKAQGEKTELWR